MNSDEKSTRFDEIEARLDKMDKALEALANVLANHQHDEEGVFVKQRMT